jgi:hypothetical protein
MGPFTEDARLHRAVRQIREVAQDLKITMQDKNERDEEERQGNTRTREMAGSGFMRSLKTAQLTCFDCCAIA